MWQLNRILSRYLRIKISGQIFLLEQNPSWDLLQEADDLYLEIVDRGRFSGVPPISDAPTLCIREGLLDSDWKKQVDKMSAALDNTLVSLYQNREDPKQVRANRSRIAGMRQALNDVTSIIFKMESLTIEGAAEDARQEFILTNTVFDSNFKPAKNKVSYDVLRMHYSKRIPKTEDIREAARSPEWRIAWSAKKQDVFPAMPLNSIQMKLANFTQFYDNVQKSEDPPPQSVIDDDDMLDGWVIWSSKSEDEKQKLSPKVARHSEQFIMVNNQEEANEIFNQNSPQAKAKMKTRQSQLERRGAVQHADFLDVRVDAANVKR